MAVTFIEDTTEQTGVAFTPDQEDISRPDPLEAGQLADSALKQATEQGIPFTAAHSEVLANDRNERIQARETIKQYTSFPGKMQFATFGKGATLATAGLMNTLADMAEGLSDLGSKIGLPEEKKAEFFRGIADTATKSSEYWENVLQNEGADGLDRLIGGTLGAVGPGVAEWTLGVPFAAGAGAAEANKEGKSIIKGAAVEGAKRYVLGKLLDYYTIIKNPVVRRTLGASTLGGATAIEGGNAEDIATQAVMGAVFANKAKGLGEAPAMSKWATDAVSKQKDIPSLQRATGEQIEPLKAKVLDQLKTAEAPRAAIEVEKTAELARRATRSAEEADAAIGENRLAASLRPLKGELTDYQRPDFKPLRETMSEPEINTMFDDVFVRPHTQDQFSKINTAKAWQKVVDGYVPTRGEILLLEKQWGPEFADGLLAKRPFFERFWDFVPEASNFLRTIAGADISVGGRQLRVLAQRFPKEVLPAIGKGAEAYKQELLVKSDVVAKAIRNEYQSSEFHGEARKYIEFFEPAGTKSTSAYELPEWYTARTPEKLPLIGRMIKAGNVNYVETYNSAMQAVWDRLRIHDLKMAETKAAEVGGKAKDFDLTQDQLRQRGDWLMAMSGRSKFKSSIIKKISPIMSGLMFAPRFAVSRFTTPMYMAKLASGDPVARAIGKDTAIGFSSFIGTNIAALTLAKIAFGDEAEVELNPLSTDFGKVRIGDTRLDLWAGYAPAIRFLSQLAMGETETAAGKIRERDRRDIIARFAQSKESPIIGLISDLYTGKTFSGEKPTIANEAYNRLTFLWVQDFVDAAKNDGWLAGLAGGAASFAGQGITSYPDTAYTKMVIEKDRIAQEAHGKNWEDLSPIQQRKLERTNKTSIAQMQRESKKEQASKDDYAFVAKLVEDEKEAGKNVVSKLDKQSQSEIESAGISVGLSRKSGKYIMNDANYQKYQDETVGILNTQLTRLHARPNWDTLSDEKKQVKLNDIISKAKEKARKNVMSSANKEGRMAVNQE